MATEPAVKDEEKTGTVVAKGRTGTVAIPEGGGAKLESLMLAIKDQDEDKERDPMDAIIEQVLNASSPEAVLTPVEAMQARDVDSVPLMLLGFELNKSEFDAGSPMYASIHVMGPDEMTATINCGHKKLLAQLVKLEQFGEYPYRVQFITRRKSKHGTPMYELIEWKEEEQPEPPPS